MKEIIDRLYLSFSKLADLFTDFLPKLLIAFMVFFLGWLIAKVIRSVVKKILKKVRIDEFAKKVELDKILNQISKDFTLSNFLASLVYFLIVFVFLTISTEILGLDIITNGIEAIIAYIPQIFIAFVIFVVGSYVANIIKNTIYSAANSIGISGARIIANIVFYLLMIFVLITALNQAGVDTNIITQNLTLILGAILLSFSISYAFASRQIVRNMLSSYYRKGKFVVGQKIKIDDVEGVIESIDNLSVSIRTQNALVVLPCKILVENKVEIIEDVSFAPQNNN